MPALIVFLACSKPSVEPELYASRPGPPITVGAVNWQAQKAVDTRLQRLSYEELEGILQCCNLPWADAGDKKVGLS